MQLKVHELSVLRMFVTTEDRQSSTVQHVSVIVAAHMVYDTLSCPLFFSLVPTCSSPASH